MMVYFYLGFAVYLMGLFAGFVWLNLKYERLEDPVYPRGQGIYRWFHRGTDYIAQHVPVTIAGICFWPLTLTAYVVGNIALLVLLCVGFTLNALWHSPTLLADYIVERRSRK